MSTYDKKMQKLFEGFRTILKEEDIAAQDTAADGQMLENLRVGVIERLVKVLEELQDQSNVMGVNSSEIEIALRDCIQRIQEPPQEP